jgi:Cytochrome c/PQQ-like domain
MSVSTDPASETWLYVPSWGKPTEAAKFPLTNGTVELGSIMAFTIENDKLGNLMLAPRWISSDIAVPEPVAIVGGVVFALGTGENPVQVRNGDIEQGLSDREKRNSDHAILHALDARTGREMWSSENAITGWTHFSGLAVGDGKVFVTTHDSAVYAFGLRAPGAYSIVMTVVPGSGQSRSGPPLTGSTSTASMGAGMPQCGGIGELFQKRCSGCHGVDGKGDRAVHTPDLTDPGWQAGKSDAVLLDSITKVRPAECQLLATN